MNLNRRDFLALGLAAAGAGCCSVAQAKRGRSWYNGVEVGCITYSYRSMPKPNDAASVIRYALDSGLGTLELKGEVVDAFLGKSRDMSKLPVLKKMFDDAGISLHIVKYGRIGAGKPEDDEYYVAVAKALGAPCITREIPKPEAYETIGRRCAQIADTSGVLIAFHNHMQIDALTYDGPLLAMSDKLRINFDIGHYVAASTDDTKRYIDPLAFIEKYHDKIYSIHLKDRTTKAHGSKNKPFGEGDTPLAKLFPFLQRKGYNFWCDIELEYGIPKGSDAVKEVARCNAFCRKAAGAALAGCRSWGEPARDPAVAAELRRQIDDGLVWGGVCGMADGPLYVDGRQWFKPVSKPMAADSIFDLASVGKTFTAFLCAKLYAEGKLDPDAPFTKYLPQHVLAKENCAITVRDLATHSGGFDNAKPYIVDDPKAFDRILYQKRPVRARGERYEYACSNYIYLGRIVENLTGLDLETAARTFIWEPLGMKDTCWHNIPDHPRAVQNGLNGAPPIGVKGDESARAYPKAMGNGAAFSSAPDMLRFADAMLNRRLLPKSAYDLLFTCCYEKDGFRRSFGWDMSAKTTPQGWSVRTINHGGFTGNTLAIDPENGYAGIVLTNRRGDWGKGYDGRKCLLSLMVGVKGVC